MIEYNENEWVTPARAAEEMSKKAGYKVTTDDIRQLKRTGKISKVQKIGERITLYNLQEILDTKPPKKRNPQPVSEGATHVVAENESKDEIATADE